MPYLGFAPWMQKLVADDRIEAHSWPLGITAYWFREVASGRPGVLTKIGVDTQLDPRKEGCSLNGRGRKEQTCRIETARIDGDELLFYHAPKPEYALVRASTSDEAGNLTMEDEGIRGTVLNIAQATKARPSPGVVIAQVKWLTKSGSMNPRDVEVPGPLVDSVVVSPRAQHWQSSRFEYDPRISYRVMPPLTGEALREFATRAPEGCERVIARRILLELIGVLEKKASPVMVNLGLGVPALVSQIAAEEEVAQYVITVLESGLWGGIALSGEEFGLALSPFALSSIPDMFSNFEGGVIDAASLGFLQVDSEGNVNPSMLPGRIYGPGGFPDIAGGSPRVYFAGAFTAGQQDVKVERGGLRIGGDGKTLKFVNHVYKSFFSAKQAAKSGQDILYVTERAVFRLKGAKLVLEEIAPGIDLEKNILDRMEYKPSVSRKLKEMDKVLFRRGRMGAKELISHISRR